MESSGFDNLHTKEVEHLCDKKSKSYTEPSHESLWDHVIIYTLFFTFHD